MAEFHILLQYISKQHTGAENKILLRIFDQCAAKTCIFSYATRSDLGVGGGGADGVYAHPKIWPKWCRPHGRQFRVSVWRKRINTWKQKKGNLTEFIIKQVKPYRIFKNVIILKLQATKRFWPWLRGKMINASIDCSLTQTVHFCRSMILLLIQLLFSASCFKLEVVLHMLMRNNYSFFWFEILLTHSIV